MVHLLEQSVASVEQIVSNQFGLTRTQSGFLGTAFRFPYGVGAIFAGMLADRLGPQRVLSIYLTGAAVICFSMQFTVSSSALYLQLFMLGCFASMYHPAGLALLANSTTIKERTRALGLHGVFGSTGIAAAPFLAGITLSVPSATWRWYYTLLGLISGLLAWMVMLRLKSPRTARVAVPLPIPAAAVVPAAVNVSVPVAFSVNGSADCSPSDSSEDAGAETVEPSSTVDPAPSGSSEPVPPTGRLIRLPYAALVLSSGISGIVYGGFLHFLKRYLSEVPELAPASYSDFAGRDVMASYYAAIVLICGAAGQFFVGRVAGGGNLAKLLSVSYASNAPFLIWMSFADGIDRLVATCLLAFAHFTNQPLYNSLLPEYIPPGKRSTWFGFSNMMGFGVGAIGPSLVGAFSDYREAYLTLAGLALVAAACPAILWMKRPEATADQCR